MHRFGGICKNPQIVGTQLRDGTPPETRQTFERLVAEGYTPEGARQLLAHVCGGA